LLLFGSALALIFHCTRLASYITMSLAAHETDSTKKVSSDRPLEATRAHGSPSAAIQIGKAVLEAIKAGAPNVDLVSPCSSPASSPGPTEQRKLNASPLNHEQSLLPDLVDMSPASITENVHAINALCPDPRCVVEA